jgi:hypothetical protein
MTQTNPGLGGNQPGASTTVPKPDLARRIELHHVLVRRRRWSNELDQICARMVRRG